MIHSPEALAEAVERLTKLWRFFELIDRDGLGSAGRHAARMGVGFDSLAADLRLAVAALADPAMVLVPREPTEAMTNAGLGCIKDGLAINDDAERSVRHAWRAMIAATLTERAK